ncbi:hypothetical protein [Gordonia sihwensis]|uniref:hypothetical protein n=1 Tax=Gordonia sihwensis TaxID=173559 RepID=UPI003D98E10D
MTELLAKARNAQRSIPDPLGHVPFLKGSALQEYVATHGGPVTLLASFDDWDCIHLSGLSPLAFLDSRFITTPHMLVQCADNEWAAVDNVNVGYGGTGGANARRELLGIGLAPDLADKVSNHRVSIVPLDTDLRAGTAAHFSQQWPHTDLTGLQLAHDRLVVPVDADGFGQIDEQSMATTRETADTLHGFYPAPPGRHPLTAWLERLDEPGLTWLDGSRRARVYLDRDTAYADGYTSRSLDRWTGLATYTVIIEQGPLQLWLDVPRSNDPGRRFSPEVHSALEAAGFYTGDLDPTAGSGAFIRWVSSLGRTPPPYVDLDDTPLRYPNPSVG